MYIFDYMCNFKNRNEGSSPVRTGTEEKDANAEVTKLFNVTTEHELVHYGDKQDRIIGNVDVKDNQGNKIDIIEGGKKEAGKNYEHKTYGKEIGLDNLPKAKDAYLKSNDNKTKDGKK